MSKKKFTDGLESLFGSPSMGDLHEDSPLLVETRKEARKSKKNTKSKDKEQKKAEKVKAKKRSGKSFTSDLDSLFDTVITKVTREDVGKKDNPSRSKASKSRKLARKPLSGLDALFRETSDGKHVEIELPPAGRKRLTITIEKTSLSKLKSIAKAEKLYLKDIIGHLVNEYISKHEKKTKN